MSKQFMEIEKQKEASIKKILLDIKSNIDKTKIINENHLKNIEEIKQYLKEQNIDVKNIKENIIESINKNNLEIDEIFNTISIDMLIFYNRIENSIKDKYVKLQNDFNKIEFNSPENMDLKILIIEEKYSIVEKLLIESKSIRDIAKGKIESLKARKEDLEKQIQDKGINPFDISNEIEIRKKELEFTQNKIIEDLKVIINVFKENSDVDKEILNQWEKILFENLK